MFALLNDCFSFKAGQRIGDNPSNALLSLGLMKMEQNFCLLMSSLDVNDF